MMKKKILIRFIYPVLVAGILFVSIGYALSDDLYFRRLMDQNHVDDVDELFAFLEPRLCEPKGCTVRGLTPRYMYDVQLIENGLYCDEGAVMMATMAKILGYDTRLLDFVGKDGIAHHTVLEIYVDGEWLVFDTLEKIPHMQVDQFPSFTASLRRRKFPRTYNFFVQHNYFLKKAAVFLRGIPG
jgi:hypothetical protein